MKTHYILAIVLGAILVSKPADGEVPDLPENRLPQSEALANQPQSEEEIWDHFYDMCATSPTSRCYKSWLPRIRNGEILPAVPFETNERFQVFEDPFPYWRKCELLGLWSESKWENYCAGLDWRGKSLLGDEIYRKQLAIKNLKSRENKP